MESSGNLSNSILQLQSSENFSPVSTTDNYMGETSFLDTLKNMSVTTWVIIIFVFAFFGINIFIYLAKGTQDITNFFKPLVDKMASLFGGITGQIIDVSAEGAKSVVNTTANVADTGLTAIQDITPGGEESKSKNSPELVKKTIPQPDITQANALNKALNTSKQSNETTNDYQEDDASSNIQNGAPKAGWCYIGEDRGFRSCAKVGTQDKCMSGNIFPTHEICVNPSLRA
jgi:hypothetical protein